MFGLSLHDVKGWVLMSIAWMSRLMAAMFSHDTEVMTSERQVCIPAEPI